MKNPNILLLFLCIASFSAIASYPDPTRPPNFIDQTNPTKSADNPTEFNFTAVFIYPGSKVALINGETFRLGEQIGEYTVTTIAPNTVELTGSEGSKEILTLIPAVKVRTAG